MTVTRLGHAAPTGPPAASPTRGSRRLRWVGALAVAAVLAGAVVLSLLPLASPPAPTQDTVAGFSVARAGADLARVAARPHPLGSPAQAEVESFLLGELRGMGLDPQVQAETVTVPGGGADSVWTAPVRNVVVRLTGTAPDHDAAVLLGAHYDSVPSGPGAGDNGAGVVAVLGTMRALASGPPPAHDVIAVFTDGEEHEMLGSRAFVDAHPWARDARVALNTEGVGNAGRVTPALTTTRNGWILRQYLQAVDRPAVYTALDAPLNRFDQGADLGRYQEAVPAGLEFSIIGGLPVYHAGTDTAAALDRGTLAEYGTVVLQLTRRLANGDLRSVTAGDLVAFTLLGPLTVAYPAGWSLPLAVLAVVAVIGAVAVAVRRGGLRIRRVLTAWLGLGGAVLAGLAVGSGAWLLARAVDPRLSDAINGGSYHRLPILLAVCAAALGAFLLVLWPLRRRHSGLELLGGAVIVAALFALLLALTLPTAAHVTTWPSLAGAAAFGVLAWRPRSRTTQLAVGTAAAIPAVLLAAPLVALYSVLAARFELSGLPVATPLPLLWLMLGLAVVVPLVTVAVRRIGWRPAAVSAGVALALVGAGVVVDAADSSPRPDSLLYQVDADTGTARWIAVPGVDAYTGSVAASGWRATTVEADPFHRAGERSGAQAVAAPATATIAAPAVTVTGDTTTGRARTVELETAALPGYYALAVDLGAAGGIRGVTVNGRPVPEATAGTPGEVHVAAFAPEQPVTIVATVSPGRAVQLHLAAYRLGFPGDLPRRPGPRTAQQTAGPYEATDATVVTRSLTLRPAP